MRRLLPLLFLLPAQAGSTPVVVFEGQGLGHGVGLPLDGATVMALADEDTDSDDLLDRFYPGAGTSRRQGIVRVLVDVAERPEQGLTLVLPGGGAVRDGRTTAVAPSFPLNVPSGGRVKLTFEDGFYRAEVTGRRADAALGASQEALWIEARRGSSIEVGGRRHPGPFEFVVAAERAHVVAELDVEQYVAGIDPSLSGGTLPEPVVEAVVIAARSYALRAAAAEMRVGRFHLFSDTRSFPYLGEEAPPEVVRAATLTEGEVLTEDGQVLEALVTGGGAGQTASAAEVFGPRAEGLDALSGVEYETDRPQRWRVEMNLSEVAERLGYQGTARGLEVTDVSPSGRPLTMVLTGSAGELRVPSPQFHEILGLPSTWFQTSVEDRAEPVASRDDSPPFQQLPGPVPDTPGTTESEGDGGVPVVPLALGVGAVILLAVLARWWFRS